jgi:hypothetical protein
MIKVVGPSTVFEYYLNDPTTPFLVTKVPVPKIQDIKPKIAVIGFREGPLVQQDIVRVQAASVYVSIVFTLQWVNKIRPITKWATTDTLTAVPRAGRQLNAYYDRFGLHFFYDIHPITKKVIFAADSTEAVYHEFGHAILDAFRPDLWDLGIFELFAFHEAFGDIISMLSSLHHPVIIDELMRETGGEIQKSNIVSRIAEELGNAIYHKEPHNGRPENCLRDATIFFPYEEPSRLPAKASYKVLAREPHNFSRIFSGAWYSLLVELYQRNRQQTDDVAALIKARDVMAKLTLKSLEQLEKRTHIYNAMAHALLRTDFEELGGEHCDLIRKVFSARNILSPQILY